MSSFVIACFCVSCVCGDVFVCLLFKIKRANSSRNCGAGVRFTKKFGFINCVDNVSWSPFLRLFSKADVSRRRRCIAKVDN